MPWINLHRDTGRNLRIAFQQSHLSAVNQRIVVVGHVADAVALMLLMGVFHLALLHVIGGARETSAGLAVLVIGVPAAVVEMQVGVDDDVDLVGRHAGLLKALQQARLVIVNGAPLVAELAADAGVDQHIVLAGADQQRVGAQRNPVELVRRDAFLPHDLGNDAEHGAAIVPVGAVGEDGEFKIAQRHAVQKNVSPALVELVSQIGLYQGTAAAVPLTGRALHRALDPVYSG